MQDKTSGGTGAEGAIATPPNLEPGLGNLPTALDTFAAAAERIDDASLVIEATGQHLAEAARRLDQISMQLREALGDMFGALEPPPWEPDPDGRLIPASFPSVGDGRGGQGVGAPFERANQAGSGLADAFAQIEPAGQAVGEVLVVDDARLAAVAESLDRAAQNVDGFGDSMTELKDIGERTFGRLQEVLVGFAETGKFEWRDLARVALDAISDIFAAQVGSSGGGGPLCGIGSILSGITSTLGGLFGGGGAPTPLQLSGPFQHGGSFVVGGSGAPDSRLVSFLATPGERVDVLTPAQQGALAGTAPQKAVNQKFVINISPGVPEAVRAPFAAALSIPLDHSARFAVG
ncbi:MAG: hypothetical protein IIA00_11355 [Proteobacteria bacterium]|nr:hypothetical protein [Pseudomonadota bacterium]